MKRIGLLIERHWHYGRRLCEGIAAYSRERGDLALEFLDWDRVGRPNALRAYDGFIARVWSPETAARLKAAGRPVVDVYGGDPTDDFVLVDQNARLISQLAVRHFIEHHFTRFAFCGYAYQRYSTLRRDSFVHALELNHFACSVFEDKSLSADKFGQKVLGKGNYDSGIRSKTLERWLARLEKPVAVFCAHDLVALDLVRACQRLSIDIPREVAVLGVDNDPLLCDFTNPAISSIDPNPFEIGNQAARTLVRWMEDPTRKPADLRPAPTGLVERMSTHIFPFPEPWLSDALIYIRRNIARNINAADVFAFLKLSHTTVERTFRARLGVSVRQEIAKVRIDEAKRLLEKTALPLSEVCSLSGFSSKAYFTAAFNEATGSTPLEWRITKRRHP
ncbi:MAG: DNA-binding transcriptional regulator [Kiritimatiellae bacterium]|nr:DNA-binding transcriptional regulator [Kiritimatiellia bacterium]